MTDYIFGLFEQCVKLMLFRTDLELIGCQFVKHNIGDRLFWLLYIFEFQ